MRAVFPRIFSICIAIVVIASILSGSFYAFVARASVYNLYASTCLGGWENTHLASGAPNATEADGAPIFTNGNSARLDGNAHAQIYCGGFAGDILENTVPKKILVKFSWATEYPKLNNGIFQAEEIATTTDAVEQAEESAQAENEDNGVPDTLNSLTEEANLESEAAVSGESVEIETPASTESTQETESSSSAEESVQQEIPLESSPEPVSEEPTASILNFFATTAYAQEISDTASSAIDTSFEVATTTQEIATSTPASSYGLVEALYTLDGVEWKSLGFVDKDEFGNKYFEIPIEEASDWEDISKIQIGIQSVPVVDGIAPIMYLDAVWLEVEYQNALEDPLVPPGEKDEDVILSEISYENMTAVLVERNPSVLFGNPTYELWFYRLSSPDRADLLLVNKSQSMAEATEKEWRFITDDFLSRDTRILFVGGNIFWFESDGSVVWKFNTYVNSYESVAVNQSEMLQLYFKDEAGETQVFEKDFQENVHFFEAIEE